MQFPVYFRRRKGSGTDPLLGSDAAPTFASPTGKGPRDCVLSHKFARPTHRVAVGCWYEGVGTPVDLAVSVWIWDDAIPGGRWFQSDAGTLRNGEITFLQIPVLDDPPPTAARMGHPQNGFEVLILVSDNSAPNGTYHFVAGPDAAIF